MSWSNNFTSPNWAGNENATGGERVGNEVKNLYIVPNPPTIEENPRLGLEGRNEVPLPTKYRDLDVKNLTAENFNGGVLDVSRWSQFPAISNVNATLLPLNPILPLLPRRQYDINNFRDATFRNVNCLPDGFAGGTLTAITGNITQVNCANTEASVGVNVGLESGVGLVEVDGVNKLAGQNALYVNGGTTLTGGGTIHGITIGTQPIAGFDSIRLEVLPAGIFMNTIAFPIEMASGSAMVITAGGATSVSAGGALSLAGGSYVEYNSDQHYFINTSAGNDFTDIYVANIHPADGGTQPLNINGDRGVQIDNVKRINLFSDASVPEWNNLTTYNPDTIVVISTTYYVCRTLNANTDPTTTIPLFVLNDPYAQNQVIYQDAVGAYRAKTTIADATLNPSDDETNWEYLFPEQDIARIWDIHTSTASTITGDPASILTIGTINSTSNVVGVEVSGVGLHGNLGTEGLYNFNYLRLQRQIGSDASVQFFDASDLKAQIKYGADDKLNIISNVGLVINNTEGATDFSNGSVEKIKTLTLTTDLASFWNPATAYSGFNRVQYGNSNYLSQIEPPKINLNNEPSVPIAEWVNAGSYEIGNIRYDAVELKSYYCKTAISPSVLRPALDSANWEFFINTADSGEVWYSNTLVESNIVGDRLSGITIGKQTFTGVPGTYLTIEQNPDDLTLPDAIISSPGTLITLGTTGLVLASITGDTNIFSVEGDLLLQSLVGDVGISSANSFLIVAEDILDITSLNGVINIETEGVSGGISVSSAANMLLSASADMVISTTLDELSTLTMTSTGDMSIATLGVDIPLTITSSGATNIDATNILTLDGEQGTTLGSSAGTTSINGFSGISLTSADAITLQSTASDINLYAGSTSAVISNSNLRFDEGGDKITGKATGLTIENVVAITTPAVGGNITINGYYPPLTIYKNAIIGSAISRAANTAEIQVYPQTYTLKANTQYSLNMSYAGLTENLSTATPNNNYYIIYRIHQGVPPLLNTNLWGVINLFNSTQQADGRTTCFMTTTAGTYTGRFYIRNQNISVALNVANISATITEIF